MTGRPRATPGDTPIVETLYRTEASTLARAARGRADRDEPIDLVHDTFVRLLRLGPDRLRLLAGERPVAYLWRVAKHLKLDRARRDLRRSVVSHVPIDDVDVPGCDVERQLEARDALRRVERAIAVMRPRTRAIFLAHRVDGMSYTEIAQECGISVKGVEKQMSRAIAILAEEMDNARHG